MSVTSNILAINTGNLKSGGVSVRTEVLGGVGAVIPEVGGGGHSGLGQRGKEEERSTPRVWTCQAANARMLLRLPTCKPRRGDQAAEVSF